MAKRRLDVFAERLPGAEQQRLHGGHGRIEHGRNFLVVQFLLVAQGESDLLLAGQPGNMGQ